MSAAGIGGTSFHWRDSIMTQLQSRDRQEYSPFKDLVDAHSCLREQNLRLSLENEKLRREGGGGVGGDGATLLALESKLLAQQEELTELHRKRGENAQILVDLNTSLQEKEKALAALEERLADMAATNTILKAEIQRYKTSKAELESLNQFLRDEHQALQLAFTHLEEKLRKAQDENREIFETLMKYKSKDAEKLNEENENFVRWRQQKVQKELEDAAKDTRGMSPDTGGFGEYFLMPQKSVVPMCPAVVFDAHDSEVTAAKWSPVERTLATGGADRKVKLWDTSKGKAENKGMLVGSNAGVMSVDYDSTGSLILGASTDFATRVWTVADQRLRHTLTGHCGKVLAAKFLGEQNKVVTGSHDRTLKIWDLRSRACVETKFAGSSCNDLVTSDGAGTTIISGHFDKTIKFWDTRGELPVNTIQVQGKVTSLDLSRDAKILLCCVRDDTLRIIDLRRNEIINTFAAEGFKTGCDWTRAVFLLEGSHVAVGSSDGGIYIWNVSSNNLLPVLRHHTSPVMAVAWHPFTNLLASVDRSKKAIIWADV